MMLRKNYNIFSFSKIFLIGILSFTLLFTFSIQNADAASPTCPSISGFRLSYYDFSPKGSYATLDCEYKTSDGFVAGSLRANYDTGSERASITTNQCSGKNIRSDDGGQWFSSTHQLNVIYKSDRYEKSIFSGAQSLLKQIQSKNLALSCNNTPNPSPTPTPSPSPTPIPPPHPERDDAAEVALALIVILIIFLTPPIIIIKKLKNRKKKTTPKYSSPPPSAVPISSDTPKILGKGAPEAPTRMPWTGMIQEPPTKVEQIAEYFSEQWEKFPDEKALENYFEKVGNCIIDAGGALHTEKAWREKYAKWAVDESRDAIPGSSYMYTYDPKSPDKIRLINGEEFGRQMASDLAKTFAGDLLKQNPGQAVKIFRKPIHPSGFLHWLVSHFGTEITTSYICMFVHLKDL